MTALRAQQRGALQQAEYARTQAVDIFRQELGESEALVSVMLGLAFNLMNQGEYQRAKEQFDLSLAVAGRLPANQLMIANICLGAGQLCRRNGDPACALEYYDRGLRGIPLANHRDEALLFATLLSSKACAMMDLRRSSDAEQLLNESISIFQRHAPRSDQYAAALSNIGALYQSRDQLAEARQFYELALKIDEAVSPTSLQTAIRYMNLSSVNAYMGDRDRAKELMRHAISLLSVAAPNSEDMQKASEFLAVLESA